MRSVVEPYILLMFAAVGLAAVLPVQGGGAVVAGGVADAGIVFLFFLYGARLSPEAALSGLRHWQLQAAILLITFALFPLLGLALRPLLEAGVSTALISGLLFLAILPSTVQSSIAFTSIARGNIPAALCAASTSNIVGVFISPLFAGWLLHTQGAQSSLEVLRDIVLQLLAPFIAGQLMRRWIVNWVTRHKAILGLADRGVILLIIYIAFSRSVVDGVWHQISLPDLLLVFLAVSCLLGGVILLAKIIARRIMKLTVEDEIVLVFCGSNKSLASGLPIASVLFAGPQLGLLLVPLILFHQLQLIVCAIIARNYAARPEPILPSASSPGAAGQV